jgi:hypothetical protein
MNRTGTAAVVAGVLLATTLAAGRAVARAAQERAAAGVRPEGTSVAFDMGRPTLVVFLRGDSPATPELLERLAERARDQGVPVAVSVRFEGLVETDAWQAARAVSEDAASDPGGREMRLFGAAPGTAAVYAPSGRLLFRGEVSDASALRALARALAPWRGFAGGPILGRAEAL